MSTTNHFSRMPAPVMWPSAYENMYGRPSNLLLADRRKKPTVRWVIVRWLVAVHTYSMCMYDSVCACFVLLLLTTEHNTRLFVQVNNVSQNLQSTDDICCINKQIKFSSICKTTRQLAKSSLVPVFICDYRFVFVCACVWKHGCALVIIHVSTRVCVARILY